MINYKFLLKLTRLFLFVICLIFFSTLQAKNFYKSENISNYFSGILLLDQSQYADAYKYLKNLDGLEKNHKNFSSKYIYSLVNSGNFTQAFNFSKKLQKSKIESFESNIVIGAYYFKNSKFDISQKYFLKAMNDNSRSLLDKYVANSLYLWSKFDTINFEEAKLSLNNLDNRFDNLKKIQKVFLNCFFNNTGTPQSFKDLVGNDKIDFSRYNYFFANYLNSVGKSKMAHDILEDSIKKYPRNLLINQYQLDLKKKNNFLNFNCKKKTNIAAEIIYISANALSSQSIFSLSNFYLNLAKFLNEDFYAFDTLLAENFYEIQDFKNAKKIYKRLTNFGEAFSWYANKQLAKILIKEKKNKKSFQLLGEAFNNLNIKDLYKIFDYAEFLKNNEEFNESIKYYSDILQQINKEHPLYPEVTDGRGVAYERIGEWEKAEKDLLSSLDSSPDQAYVINYLAYSWIEQGVKIEKSLDMLEKANKLKSNDPFIIDSLGWALFKLERYEESKVYLQTAVRLMPADPIVNDHYGDVLWKNGKRIQARYYWNYVLNLDDVKKDLKTKIEKKLITGL